ncbi:hypothetical protein SFUMM280S_01372 [Streptomyces fumanus]
MTMYARDTTPDGPDRETATGVRFRVLGPVRVWAAGAELPTGPRQQRLVLAALLARAGRPVSLEELVGLLWEEDPPRSAVNAVHRYVGALRRLLEPGLPARAPGRWLVRRAGGYLLRVGPDELDLLVFRRLVQQARAARDASEAVDRFAAALGQWQGRCAADVVPEDPAPQVFAAVDHEYVAAVSAAATAALRCGRPGAVLPAVRRAAQRHPFDERLLAQTMLLLTADGKQAEALTLYHRFRADLRDTLGMSPGKELRAAHDRILRGPEEPAVPATGPGPAGPAPARPAPAGPEPRHVPAQLPADLPCFTGRADVLEQAARFTADGAGTLRVLAVDGIAGVGKTALAVHVAHRIAARFPDGQLFADLGGFSPAGGPADAGEVLAGFLAARATTPPASSRWTSTTLNRVSIASCPKAAPEPLLPASRAARRRGRRSSMHRTPAAQGLLERLGGLDGRAADDLGDEVGAGHLDEVPGGQHVQTGQDRSVQAGDGGLAGAGRTGEDEVAAHRRGRDAELGAALGQPAETDQHVDLLLDSGQADQGVQFGERPVQRRGGRPRSGGVRARPGRGGAGGRLRYPPVVRQAVAGALQPVHGQCGAGPGVPQPGALVGVDRAAGDGHRGGPSRRIPSPVLRVRTQSVSEPLPPRPRRVPRAPACRRPAPAPGRHRRRRPRRHPRAGAAGHRAVAQRGVPAPGDRDARLAGIREGAVAELGVAALLDADRGTGAALDLAVLEAPLGAVADDGGPGGTRPRRARSGAPSRSRAACQPPWTRYGRPGRRARRARERTAVAASSATTAP